MARKKKSESDSVLLEEPIPKEAVQYTDTEARYNAAIIRRLVNAKQNRDRAHPEFNDMTYEEWYSENERMANTQMSKTDDKRKNEADDFRIATGTVEQKLLAILAEVNRLNLAPEVLAFDSNDNELVGLGLAMTDVLFKTAELDSDDEKKILRQLELLKQGTVFVQESWVKQYKKYKKIKDGRIGSIEGVDWTERLEKCFEGSSRQILYGPGVFLGDIRTLGSKDQPFIFTRKRTSYEEARGRYGATNPDGSYIWERWAFVSDKRVPQLASVDAVGFTMKVNDAWGLGDVPDGVVEEVHYYDRPNNEYQIYLNGTAMLPVGFPLSAISPGGEYPVEMQTLQYINPFFAYGRSFTSRAREQVKILDEILKLLILKTRKSIHPPYANTSNRVISRRSLMPGRITMGIDPAALTPIGQEGQGPTASEYQMFKMLSDNIDQNTVSPQFTGQQGKSGTTAFEVGVLTRQAQKMLALVIFACRLLETKLGYQRLFNVVENYFNPVDTAVDEFRNKIVNKYRTTSRKTNIDGEGMGMRQVIPVDTGLPSSEEIREEELYSETGATRAMSGLPPIKRIYIDPTALKNIRIHWFIDTDERPSETSNMAKMMFREELNDIAVLTKFGSRPNVQELEERHAIIWGRRKDKLFQATQPQPQPQPQPQEQAMGIDLGSLGQTGAQSLGQGSPAGMVAE